MTIDSDTLTQPTVAELAARARAASRQLARLSHELRNEALTSIAQAIESNSAKILKANESDYLAAEPVVKAGKMTSAIVPRPGLLKRRISPPV